MQGCTSQARRRPWAQGSRASRCARTQALPCLHAAWVTQHMANDKPHALHAAPACLSSECHLDVRLVCAMQRGILGMLGRTIHRLALCLSHCGDTQIYGLNRDPRLPVPDYHKKPKGWWSNPRKACSRMMLPLLPLTANMSTVLCGHFARAEGQCGGRAALLAEIQAIRQDLVSDAHA